MLSLVCLIRLVYITGRYEEMKCIESSIRTITWTSATEVSWSRLSESSMSLTMARNSVASPCQ